MSDVFLHPGEYHVGHAGCRIRTVLGSCVSITIWHPARQIGAMSHFLLFSRGTEGSSPTLDGRYAEEALSLMLHELAKEGVSPLECQAKLFGGGNMFPALPASGLPGIGQRNGETARRLVREQGIPIVSESLFGVGHRTIIFDITSGHVWLRQAGLPAP
jgi:chemotaxis protein CheD